MSIILSPLRDSRREFLKTAGALALVAAGGPMLAAEPEKAKSTPESLVKLLYETFTAKQKKDVCFAWDFVEKERGLLRTRLENNWKITSPSIKSSYYTGDQRQLIRKIFEGMTNPAWHERWDLQLKGDVGGFGQNQSLAILASRGATSSNSSSPAGT